MKNFLAICLLATVFLACNKDTAIEDGLEIQKQEEVKSGVHFEDNGDGTFTRVEY